MKCLSGLNFFIQHFFFFLMEIILIGFSDKHNIYGMIKVNIFLSTLVR